MKNGIVGFFKILLFFALLIIFTIFMSNNSDFVRINLAPFDYILEIKLYLVVMLSFILGIFVVILFNFITGFFGLKEFLSRFRKKRLEKEISKLKARNNQLENENDE